MAGEFGAHGRTLLGHGYLIVPILPGAKRPAIAEWEKSRLGPADVARYSGNGVGILCGQGDYPLVAIDVDVDSPALASAFVRWCRAELGITVERIGRDPKILLVYRAAGTWSKQSSPAYVNGTQFKNRVELLGHGQQFVAYAIHPETRQPYRWVDLLGGLDACPITSLPLITEGRATAALAEFSRLALAAGYTQASGAQAAPAAPAVAGDMSFMLAEQPVGLSIPELRNLLDFIPGAEEYDTWLKVGIALHMETSGSDEGLALWDAWSTQAPNYQGWEDLAARWAGFAREQRRLTGKWLQARSTEHKKTLARKERALDLATILDRISKCRHADELLNEIARDAGMVARRDLALQVQIESAIKAQFENLTTTRISPGMVRSAMSAKAPAEAPITLPAHPDAGPSIGFAWNQAGNADRMIHRYGGNLMYVLGLGWFRWAKTSWVKADIVEIQHLAYEVVRALSETVATIQNAEQRKAAEKFALASQSVGMVEAMCKLVGISKGMVYSVEMLDRNPNLIGAANGVIDLETGLLLPADRAHRITMSTGIEYDPDAQATLWESTLRDVFAGNTAMVGFLQRLMGYALLGQPTEDVLAIPYGFGCNGKSTIFNILRTAFGDYGRMAGAGTFVSERAGHGTGGSAPREDILRLRNARFVYVSEPNENSTLREDMVKSMTGGEPIAARGLYERTTVEVRPTWLCCMPTNHKPIIVGDDYGIWRRLLPIPFTVNFDDSIYWAKDPEREDKLLAELPGILAWVVRGALDYRDGGLCRPPEIDAANREYKESMDLLSEWVADSCEVGPGCEASLDQLWVCWKLWAEPRGELRLISGQKFLDRRLKTRWSFDPMRRVYRGIRPKG